tara:strand:- start:1927 stop:2451 length:525 start_codon:yes stop_codon:yes gene_type:complete
VFNIKTIIAALLLCAWSLSVISNDKIYKITTDDGGIIYTDSPTEQGEHVPLSADSVITLKSASLSPITTPPIVRKQTKKIHLSVISPKPEQTIRDNSGKLTIRTALEPQVQGVYRLHLNDQVISQNKGLFKLSGLNRGAYTFHVELAHKSGKILASTPKQTFYLHQASVLNRPN